MMVTIKLFGMTKLLAGNQGSLSLNVANGRLVKDLVRAIEISHPAVGELVQKKKVLVSVNQDIAHEDTMISEGDEIALLPPFAGGSSMNAELDDSQFVRVQRENFSIDQELDRVKSRSKRIGGLPPSSASRGIGPAGEMSMGLRLSTMKGWHRRSCARFVSEPSRIRHSRIADYSSVWSHHDRGEYCAHHRRGGAPRRGLHRLSMGYRRTQANHADLEAGTYAGRGSLGRGTSLGMGKM